MIGVMASFIVGMTLAMLLYPMDVDYYTTVNASLEMRDNDDRLIPAFLNENDAWCIPRTVTESWVGRAPDCSWLERLWSGEWTSTKPFGISKYLERGISPPMESSLLFVTTTWRTYTTGSTWTWSRSGTSIRT